MESETLEITKATLRVCLQALGELPIKIAMNAFGEIANKMAAPAVVAPPVDPVA